MAQIKDLKRMCVSHEDCEGCPFCGDCLSPDSFSDNADEIVDKWVKEHPVKTYAMDFFEKFPNAPKDDNGKPKCCCISIYGDKLKCPDGGCEECWDREMVE